MKTNRFTAEFPERLTDAPHPWGGNLYCEEGESSRKLIGVIYGESYADAEHNARFITAALNETPTLTPEQAIGPEAVEALRAFLGRDSGIAKTLARAVLAKLDSAHT